jgi:hypothetical protein
MCNLKYAAPKAIAAHGRFFGTLDQSLGRQADSICRLFLALLIWLDRACYHLLPDSLHAQITLSMPPELVMIEGHPHWACYRWISCWSAMALKSPTMGLPTPASFPAWKKTTVLKRPIAVAHAEGEQFMAKRLAVDEPFADIPLGPGKQRASGQHGCGGRQTMILKLFYTK